MTKKHKNSKQQSAKLTAHGLLGSISYWGTTARMVLVGTLVLFTYALNISVPSTFQWQNFDNATMMLIFALMTLVILDLGYVVAARSLPLSTQADRWVVMLSDLALAAFFVVPSLVVVGITTNQLRVMSLVLALLAVSIRILVGLLFAKRK